MGRKIKLRTDEIYKILKTRDIAVNTIEPLHNNDTDFLLDGKYIFRISNHETDARMKLDRVRSVSLAPKVRSSGEFIASDQKYVYLIYDYIHGSDLWSVAQILTDEQKNDIGKDIAKFLTELHTITGDHYDVGHYVPAVPEYKKSWKDGHIEYAGLLKDGLSSMELKFESKKIISGAFDYIYANIGALEYQAGARLLHNDFHPKNIIVSDGKLAGVIDWECSQYGEADFELSHLFHWQIYPPDPGKDIGAALESVFANLRVASPVPDIERRLTIYQLEHELNQLIWNGPDQEEERTRRISGWLGGKLNDLTGKWKKNNVTEFKRTMK